MDIGVKDEMCR